ncbi:uncharacterized protein EV420DRAFT_1733612 [Desarmillaria tabescens]|uniref:Uncharacterized protein n=1 Tax=Armillaria tabescens TaxID=1929756 RepID=A0AA39JC86_ARMTA|nr:uncharacterized protein EV420DRAFT_1733612 [Desarmillaria tabescens]KAK0439679.1 hypothetical protein EV420DRAFT_1733612 [Desarmillaria tabescens]
MEAAATQLSDSWFNAVIIESLAHGMYTALLAVVLWRILLFSVPPRRQTKVLAGISVFMYIMATIHIAVRWYYARRAFITKGQTEETRYFALIDSLIAGGPLWVPTIASVVASTNILMADCVIIWRCWVIWGRNWRIIVLPSICTLCGTLFDIFFLFQELTPFTGSQGSSSTPWGSDSIKWGVAYYSMTLSTTIICTVLIVYRLVQASTTSLSLSIAVNPYYRVMEIMVESAVLYVIALVIYIPFIATNNPNSLYPQVVLVSVTGIAPTLILLRVASGNQSGNTNPGSPDNTMHPGGLQSQSKLNAEGSVTCVEEDDARLIIPAKSAEVV